MSLYKIKKRSGLGLTCESLYLVTYSIYCVLFIINFSVIDISTVMVVCKAFAVMTMLFLYCIRHTIKKYRFIIAIVIGILFTLSTLTSGRNTLFVYAMFIINSDVADFEKIAKCSLRFTFFPTVIIMIMTYAGMLKDWQFQRGNEIAHSMGFSYYSTYPYIFLFNMISYFYLKREKVPLIHIVLFSLLNIYIYKISTLRLSFYLSFAVIIVFIIALKIHKINTNRPFFRMAVSLLFPIAFGISVLLSLKYTPHERFWREFDHLLSGRLALQATGFQRYSVKVLGQVIETNALTNGKVAQVNYFYIDSGYIYSILGYGILLTMLLLSMYCYLAYRSCKKNDIMAVIWLGTLAIFTMINNVWINIPYNCILLLFIREIQYDDSKKRKERIIGCLLGNERTKCEY